MPGTSRVGDSFTPRWPLDEEFATHRIAFSREGCICQAAATLLGYGLPGGTGSALLNVGMNAPVVAEIRETIGLSPINAYITRPFDCES